MQLDEACAADSTEKGLLYQQLLYRSQSNGSLPIDAVSFESSHLVLVWISDVREIVNLCPRPQSPHPPSPNPIEELHNAQHCTLAGKSGSPHLLVECATCSPIHVELENALLLLHGIHIEHTGLEYQR